jgi:hypothetical protein
MRRLLLPILASLAVLPFTLLGIVLDTLDAIADDEDARVDAAIFLIAVVALIGWACGVFEE